MRYALFVHDKSDSLDPLTDEEKQRVYDEYVAVSELPGLVGYRLQPPATATTVRISNGKPLTASGPPGESELSLIGFYLLETDDREQALEVAARIPAVALGGAVQVQPLVSEE
jgi:hypothetical protein